MTLWRQGMPRAGAPIDLFIDSVSLENGSEPDHWAGRSRISVLFCLLDCIPRCPRIISAAMIKLLPQGIEIENQFLALARAVAAAIFYAIGAYVRYVLVISDEYKFVSESWRLSNSMELK